MSTEVEYGKDLPCDECGAFGAYNFDSVRLCLNCYEGKGSCCPEFDKSPEKSAPEVTRDCQSLPH